MRLERFPSETKRRRDTSGEYMCYLSQSYYSVKMKTITATELARNLRRVLDPVVSDGEEIVIERNHEQVARLVAGPGRQNALEVMADLYHTLPDDVAATWETDARQAHLKGAKSLGACAIHGVPNRHLRMDRRRRRTPGPS